MLLLTKWSKEKTAPFHELIVKLNFTDTDTGFQLTAIIEDGHEVWRLNHKRIN
jgi:hypothetical protein